MTEPVAPARRPDDEWVTELLGRRPRGAFEVAARRPDGQPVVLRNAPFLDDGTPMPTLFWLCDPRLVAAVSRLEADGGVDRAEAEVDAAELVASHARYESRRDRLVLGDAARAAGPRPSGGVGGTRRGVKCLHTHLAWHLVGGDDPVGRWTVARLDPAVLEDVAVVLPEATS